MDALKIEKFFCKWSLRTGAIAIGLFHAIASVLYFLTSIIDAAASEVTEGMSRVYIASALVFLIKDCSLLYGVIKEKRLFMLPFLMFEGSVINLIVFALFTFSLVNPLILLFGLLLAPFIYSLMCVYSYYAELDPLRSGYPNNMMNQRTLEQIKIPEDI